MPGSTAVIQESRRRLKPGENRLPEFLHVCNVLKQGFFGGFNVAGGLHTLAINGRGELFLWGSGNYGRLGDLDTSAAAVSAVWLGSSLQYGFVFFVFQVEIMIYLIDLT